MEFKNEEHRSFWINSMNYAMKNHIIITPRVTSFFYVLGLSTNLIGHVNEIFDWDSRSIITDVMKETWLSEDDLKKIRLAFYFFCDWCYENDTDASIGYRSDKYTLNSFFAEGTNAFYYEALSLRYQVDSSLVNKILSIDAHTKENQYES